MKHWAYPSKRYPLFTQAPPPRPSSSHRILLMAALFLLYGTTTAAAMKMGHAAGANPRAASVARAAADANLQLVAAAMVQGRPELQQHYTPPAAQPQARPAQSPPPTPAGDCVAPFIPHGSVNPDPSGSHTKDPECGWAIGDHPELTPEHRKRLQELLLERKHTCFAYSMKDMPGYHGQDGPFTIELTHDKPILNKPRRYSPAETKVRDAKCGELREAEFIVRAPPGTQYQCRPTMPAKKGPDGLWTDHRFCIDYRPVNGSTIPDRYGLHMADDLYRQVGTARFFSKIDLKGAFHQVPVAKADQPKTAFWWGNELWMYTRMPYGMVSGSAKCQRIMDTEIALAGLTGNALCFVDDLLVYSDSVEEHLQHVAAVLDMLHNCGLRAHPEKCLFFTEQVEFLGHLISAQGLSPHDSKVAAIKALASPCNLGELRSKLAFINYYRCYIPQFSTIAAPLNALLKKDAAWTWGESEEAAWQQLKDIVCTPGIVLKRFDEKLPITVYTDWSGVGIGAVLAQHDGEQEHMVACISRSLNPHEKNYSSYEGEMLAAVWGTRAFRQYLHGLHFKLVTDHQPLKWLMGTPELTGKHMRWALSMQEYDFVIEHRKGSAHANVDVPSRFPLQASHDPTGACLDPVQHAADTPPSSTTSPAAVLATFPSFDHSPTTPNPSPSIARGTAAAAGARCVSESVKRWLGATADERASLRPAEQSWVPKPSATTDVFGIRDTDVLCTKVLGHAFLSVALEEGIVLYEPFGGLCAGLDMVLANGIPVNRYYYSDIDTSALQVAHSRVRQLQQRYPDLFPQSASQNAFDTLPMDVRKVDSRALVNAGATDGQQWLVVAGWSCEDLSAAGKGAGLAGTRSSNFHDAVRIVGALQQLQPVRPPAYMLENTGMQAPWGHSRVRQHDFPEICRVVGQPVLIDAARFGSHAHRLRNYWTNLAAPEHVDLVVQQVQRAPGRTVRDVLDPHHRVQTATSPDMHPHYPCNEVGKPLVVLPTLVAFPQSKAFRGEGKGLLHVVGTSRMEQPNPDERERILGYPTGCTKVGSLTEAQRHAITGRAMDRFSTINLFKIYCALAVEQCNEVASCSLYSSRAADVQAEMPFLNAVAARIMCRWGWKPGGPLLAPSAVNPIVEPVKLVANVGRRGLGYVPELGGGNHSWGPPEALQQEHEAADGGLSSR